MSDSISTAMVGSLSDGGTAAGKVLRMLIGDAAGVDERRQLLKENARVAVGSQPVTALALLNVPASVGLTVREAADVLDEVVASFASSDDARSAIERVISSEQRIELLAARGDLGSSAALVVAPEDILAAMLQDVGGELEGPSGALFVRSWILKLRDRDDFHDILELEVTSGMRVRDFALYALYLDQGCPDELESMSAAFVDELDMEPDEARGQLESLIARGIARRLKPKTIAAARARLTEKRQEAERRLRTSAELAQAEAASAAEDLFS